MLKTSIITLATLLALSSAAHAQTSTRECDMLAASALDPERPSEIAGVAFGQINVTLAEEACRAAWETDPVPRFAYQLGRVLLQAERYDEALTYFQHAIDEGHVEALNGAAQAVTAQAEQKSRQLMMQAATQMSLTALYNLGVIAMDEEEDGELALGFFKTAAELGDAEAAYNAAVIYDEGKLVVRDIAKARQFYEQAVAGDYTLAKINLAHILIETEPLADVRDEVIALLAAAADDDGDVEAGVDLALVLQHGDEADKAEAAARLITGLKARDLFLAEILIEENGKLLPHARQALWAELGASSHEDAVAKLTSLYQAAQ